MSVFAPDTDLRLIKSPLTFGDGHQLDFANATAQANYFLSLPGVSYTDFTYQRKDNIIRVPDLAENIYQYNYVMYRNKASAKWFYAFITKIEFVNQNCTHVRIKTDVFQTWQFAFSFKQCTTIREHVHIDTSFSHTLPENIDCGEVYEVARTNALPYSLSNLNDAEFDSNYRILVVASEPLEAFAGSNTAQNPMVCGIPGACHYYGIGRANIRAALNQVVADGKVDAIISMYCVPIGALAWEQYVSTGLAYDTWFAHDKTPKYSDVSVLLPTQKVLNGVLIKNRKCMMYPYHFYVLHSSNGQQMIIEPQKIHNSAQVTVRTWFAGNCNPSILAKPINYGTQLSNGVSVNEYITYTDFPVVPFTVDAYQRYVAENKAQLAYTQIKGAIDIGLGVAGMVAGIGLPAAIGGGMITPGGGVNVAPGGIAFSPDEAAIMGSAGQFGAGLRSTVGYLTNLADLKRRPDSVRGCLTGDATFVSGVNGIWISEMSIKPEYVHIVDNYFTAYGYKTMRLGVPTFKTRTAFNYIQTQDCNLEGDMPQDDSDELCALFNGGLTVWHNPATFGDYTQANEPT